MKSKQFYVFIAFNLICGYRRNKINNLEERRPKIFINTKKTDRSGERGNGNLTSLKLVLWNSGTENIDKEVKIVLPDGVDIQDAKVVSSLNPLNNNVKVNVDPVSKNTAVINFDNLSMKEGCLISLLHTNSTEQAQQDLLKKGISDLEKEPPNPLKKEISN